MRKWTAGLVALFVLMLALAGCGQQPTNQGNDDTPKASDNGGEKKGDAAAGGEKQVLTFYTGQVGGSWYSFAAPMAQVVNQKMKKYKLNVVPGGAVENVRYLNDGTAQFGMSGANGVYGALQGNKPFDSKMDVQPIANIYPTVGVAFALKSSGIKSFDDIRGKRVAVGPAGSTMIVQNTQVLAAEGIDIKTDIKAQYLQTAQLWDAVKDGKVDVAMLYGNPKIPAIAQLAEEKDLVFLSVSDEAFSKLEKDYPYYQKRAVPAGTYKGLTEPAYHISFVAQIVAGPKTTDDMIVDFLDAFYGGLDDMKGSVPRIEEIDGKSLNEFRTNGFHPAAEKWYKDHNVW